MVREILRPQAETEGKKLAEALLKPIEADREALIAEANRFFNQYRANDDRYLDCDYSLSGEYARLFSVVKGGSVGSEKYLTGKMAELSGFNVDAKKIVADLSSLAAKIAN